MPDDDAVQAVADALVTTDPELAQAALEMFQALSDSWDAIVRDFDKVQKDTAGTGLTLAEHSEYWRHVAQANEVIATAARRELQPERPVHEGYVETAKAQVDRLEAALSEAVAPVDAVDGEIAEVESRLASLRVKDLPLDERISAKQLRVALKQERDELMAHKGTLTPAVDKIMADLGPARNALARSKYNLELFDAALAEPLSYERGLKTTAGAWWSSMQKQPQQGQTGLVRRGPHMYQAPDGGMVHDPSGAIDDPGRWRAAPDPAYQLSMGSGAADMAAGRQWSVGPPQPSVVAPVQPAIALPLPARDASGSPADMLRDAIQNLRTYP